MGIPKPGKAEKRPLVLTHRRPRAAQEVPKEPSSSSVSYGNTWNPLVYTHRRPRAAQEYRQEQQVQELKHGQPSNGRKWREEYSDIKLEFTKPQKIKRKKKLDAYKKDYLKVLTLSC